MELFYEEHSGFIAFLSYIAEKSLVNIYFFLSCPLQKKKTRKLADRVVNSWLRSVIFTF